MAIDGEIDVVVHAPDVATPRTIGWMLRYEDALLARYGYVEAKGCARATLCPALSLPDLFCSGSQSSGSCSSLSSAQISALLGAVPQYFSQAVITGNRREASLAFGIRLMPLARQQRVIDYMRAQLHPPPGISAQLIAPTSSQYFAARGAVVSQRSIACSSSSAGSPTDAIART